MATCPHCKAEMQTDGVNSWCVQADCYVDHYDDFDNENESDDDEDFEPDCGLMSDGQCMQAGTEHCDFGCPNRHSELFVGSAAWRKKHSKRRKARI